MTPDPCVYNHFWGHCLFILKRKDESLVGRRQEMKYLYACRNDKVTIRGRTGQNGLGALTDRLFNVSGIVLHITIG